MPKILCAHCNREYKVAKNGVYVVEMFTCDGRPEPYKLWSADGWYCPTCTQVVIAGFAQLPLFQHPDPDLPKVLDQVRREPKTWVLFDFETSAQRLAGLKLGYLDHVPTTLPKTVVAAEDD